MRAQSIESPRPGATARFQALGTYVHLGVSSEADLEMAVGIAREFLGDFDQACSRFRTDSDLSRANARAGSWTTVEPLLLAAVRTALDVATDTGGVVDPLLGRSMVALGYDRDFARLRPDGVRMLAQHDPTAWLRLELTDDAILVPAGHALDLGATGKACAADMVAAAFVQAGIGPALISIGGDIALAGDGDWPVAISEHPGSAPDQVVWLGSGGLATSSTQVRRWTAGGVRRHHLIDPRTGTCVEPTWRTVSAIGRSATAANAATTAAIVLGEDAVAWLRLRGVHARLVGVEGNVCTVGGWPREDS